MKVLSGDMDGWTGQHSEGTADAERVSCDCACTVRLRIGVRCCSSSFALRLTLSREARVRDIRLDGRLLADFALDFLWGHVAHSSACTEPSRENGVAS